MFESELAPLENVQFKPSNSDFKNKFRFLRQKKILFQMTSKYQNQFNVCANFAFIQGYYHISFFAKYWFLNNTQMPLQMQMITVKFKFLFTIMLLGLFRFWEIRTAIWVDRFWFWHHQEIYQEWWCSTWLPKQKGRGQRKKM